MLIYAKNAKPSDPAVYMTLAGYYNRQGQFDKTIDALKPARRRRAEQPGSVPDHRRLLLGRGARRSVPDRSQEEGILEKGIEAVDKALSLKADFVEALTFKGLLLRQQALIEKDPAKQQQLLKDGTALGDKANELRKAQTSGKT